MIDILCGTLNHQYDNFLGISLPTWIEIDRIHWPQSLGRWFVALVVVTKHIYNSVHKERVVDGILITTKTVLVPVENKASFNNV